MGNPCSVNLGFSIPKILFLNEGICAWMVAQDQPLFIFPKEVLHRGNTP
jgi:hypothetical protein